MTAIRRRPPSPARTNGPPRRALRGPDRRVRADVRVRNRSSACRARAPMATVPTSRLGGDAAENRSASPASCQRAPARNTQRRTRPATDRTTSPSPHVRGANRNQHRRVAADHVFQRTGERVGPGGRNHLHARWRWRYSGQTSVPRLSSVKSILSSPTPEAPDRPGQCRAPYSSSCRVHTACGCARSARRAIWRAIPP